MNNELPLTLCIFKCSFSPQLLLLLIFSFPQIDAWYQCNNKDYKRKRATGWSPSCCLGDDRGKPRHRAEGDASWSSLQGGGGGAQVNTLKSSSWDRWGVSPPPPPFCLSLINSQSKEETNVTESRQHLKLSQDFLLLCEWLSIREKTRSTIQTDHVESVNHIVYEPDRIMTENYSERFSW